MDDEVLEEEALEDPSRGGAAGGDPSRGGVASGDPSQGGAASGDSSRSGVPDATDESVGMWVVARMQQQTHPPVWQLIQPPRTTRQPLPKATKELMPQMTESGVAQKSKVSRIVQMSLTSPPDPPKAA